MPTAFVTGATGCLGQALCAELAREGWHLRSLSRSATLPDTPVERHFAVDLAQVAVPHEALEGADAVFHCAALSSAWGSRQAFLVANVTATERLLDSARKAHVPRFVFASTPSIYINGSHRLNVTEAAPLPRYFLTDYARTKFIAEELVRAANSADFATVALRPRAIYGLHDRALLPRLLSALDDRGSLKVPGGGKALIDPTHSSDAAMAMRLAAQADASIVGGRVYNITSGEAVTVDALLDALEPVLGRSIPRRNVPYQLAFLTASLAESAQRLRDPKREPKVTRHAVAAMGLSLTLDISAARRDLGYEPQVSLKQGLGGLVAAQEKAETDRDHGSIAAGPRDPAIRLQMLRVGECIAPATALRRDALPLPKVVPALVAVLDHGEGNISLFDTGYGRSWAEMSRGFPELAYRLALPSQLPDSQCLDVSLDRLGIRSVSRVVLSHLHADHATGLFDLPQMPRCLASEAAIRQLAKGSLATNTIGARLSAVMNAMPLPLLRRLKELADEGKLTAVETTGEIALPTALRGLGPGYDIMGDGSVVALPLPGHAEGQIGLWLPRTSRGPVLLAGDAAYSCAALRDCVMPPMAVLSRLGNVAAYRKTFATLAKLAAEGVQIIVSHDPTIQTV